MYFKFLYRYDIADIYDIEDIYDMRFMIYELITRNTLVGPAVRGQQCCGTNNRVTTPLADETKATTLFTNLLFQK